MNFTDRARPSAPRRPRLALKTRASVLAAVVLAALSLDARASRVSWAQGAPSSPSPSPAPAPSLGPWYGFRNGFQNRGLSPVNVAGVTSAASGRSPWSFVTHGLVWGTAVIDATGSIDVGSADKSFYSLAPDGTLEWSFTLPDVGDSLIDSAATLTPAGLVVVPGGDGSLHALDPSTGTEAWKFDSHYGNNASGVVVGSFEGNVTLGPDDRLYAGCDDSHLYCVDETGTEVWNFATGMMVWSAPAFDPTGTWLAFGSLDKNLYVLDRASGTEIAHYTGGAEFKASPTIDDNGRIYAGCSDFDVRCLELQGSPGNQTLSQVWSFSTQGEVYSSPALVGDQLVFGSADGNIYCLSTSGTLLWQYTTYSPVSSSPLVTTDGVVLAGAKNGTLYALDLATGKRIWSFKTSPGYHEVNLDALPALDATGRVIVGSYDGSIYGIPFEYASQNPTDPRVSLDPGNDIPDFGGPTPPDAAILRYVDTDGSLASQLPPLDPETLLTFQIVAHENGAYIPNAAICYDWLTVTVDPPTPVNVIVATDHTCVNIEPQGFWQPGTTYKLHVAGY